MTPLKEAIDQTIELGKKLLMENVTLKSVSFDLLDYPVDEVKAGAAQYDRTADYISSYKRVGFQFTHWVENHGFVYIHVFSVEVKAKVVYE